MKGQPGARDPPRPLIVPAQSRYCRRVIKKGGGRDARQDPEQVEDEGASNYRVDRVYAPTPARTREPSPFGSQAHITHSGVSPSDPLAIPVPGTRRPRTPTGGDAELALRRQLSQAQRQLADAQRALADKDEDVAVEVEKRLAVAAAYETLLDEHAHHTQRLEDLAAYQARTLGVEQRLLDTVTTAEEHSRARDREREARTLAEARVEELTAAVEESYRTWRTERSQLEELHVDAVTRLETQKRMASDAAGAALLATTVRLRESHDEELAQLRDSNDRSLAILRGELEPKALEALSLAEKRQELADELAALRTETTRAAAAREEAHQRDHAQLVESHVLELAQQRRQATSELTRVADEREALTVILAQSTRHAEMREQQFAQASTVAAAARARLERELMESKLSVERLLAEAALATERHVSASSTIEHLVDQKRSLRERLELSEGEARRNALDRRHFVAYLEEGLAMLREDEEPDVLITRAETEGAAANEPASDPAGTTS